MLVNMNGPLETTNILVIERGEIGKRAAKTIAEYSESTIQVFESSIPLDLDVMYEEEPAFLNEIGFSNIHIVLSYSYHIDITQFLIQRASEAGVEAFIIPGSDPAYRMLGARRQSKKLSGEMILVAPKVSCGGIPIGINPHLDRLHEHLGLPEFDIKIDESNRIVSAKVLRHSFCGCADRVAEAIVGILVDDAYNKAGLLTQAHCRAPRGYQLLRGCGEIHLSAEIHADAVARAIDAAIAKNE
jgi:hypothetical protein